MGRPSVRRDPAALLLEVEEQAPLQHQLILQADLDPAAAEASEASYATWKAAREDLLAQASHPSMSVQTVTSLARAAATEASATEINAHEAQAERVTGRTSSWR